MGTSLKKISELISKSCLNRNRSFCWSFQGYQLHVELQVLLGNIAREVRLGGLGRCINIDWFKGFDDYFFCNNLGPKDVVVSFYYGSFYKTQLLPPPG